MEHYRKEEYGEASFIDLGEWANPMSKRSYLTVKIHKSHFW